MGTETEVKPDAEALLQRLERMLSEGRPGERLITAAKFAEMLDVDETTFWRWRKAGQIPNPDVRRGTKFTRWLKSSADRYIRKLVDDARREGSGS